MLWLRGRRPVGDADYFYGLRYMSPQPCSQSARRQTATWYNTFPSKIIAWGDVEDFCP